MIRGCALIWGVSVRVHCRRVRKESAGHKKAAAGAGSAAALRNTTRRDVSPRLIKSYRLTVKEGLSDGAPEAACLREVPGKNRRKCEIVYRRPEHAILTFDHSLIHTCNRPAKSRALHFINPAAGFRGRSLTGIRAGMKAAATGSPLRMDQTAIARRQDAFIATLEIRNRDSNSVVLRHLHLDAPIESQEPIRRLVELGLKAKAKTPGYFIG